MCPRKLVTIVISGFYHQLDFSHLRHYEERSDEVIQKTVIRLDCFAAARNDVNSFRGDSSKRVMIIFCMRLGYLEIADTSSAASRNYADHPCTVFLRLISSKSLGRHRAFLQDFSLSDEKIQHNYSRRNYEKRH
jgi:hypothetical protein